jgi:hypothetical protein
MSQRVRSVGRSPTASEATPPPSALEEESPPRPTNLKPNKLPWAAALGFVAFLFVVAAFGFVFVQGLVKLGMAREAISYASVSPGKTARAFLLPEFNTLFGKLKQYRDDAEAAELRANASVAAARAVELRVESSEKKKVDAEAAAAAAENARAAAEAAARAAEQRADSSEKKRAAAQAAAAAAGEEKAAAEAAARAAEQRADSSEKKRAAAEAAAAAAGEEKAAAEAAAAAADTKKERAEAAAAAAVAEGRRAQAEVAAAAAEKEKARADAAAAEAKAAAPVASESSRALDALYAHFSEFLEDTLRAVLGRWDADKSDTLDVVEVQTALFGGKTLTQPQRQAVELLIATAAASRGAKTARIVEVHAVLLRLGDGGGAAAAAAAAAAAEGRKTRAEAAAAAAEDRKTRAEAAAAAAETKLRATVQRRDEAEAAARAAELRATSSKAAADASRAAAATARDALRAASAALRAHFAALAADAWLPIFAGWDSDGDGALGARELEAALHAIGATAGAQLGGAAELLLVALDAGGDGAVTLVEMEAFLWRCGARTPLPAAPLREGNGGAPLAPHSKGQADLQAAARREAAAGGVKVGGGREGEGNHRAPG